MSKNKVEVLIGGNIYALQGTESEEHIHQVANVINKHIQQVKKADLAHRLNTTQVHMLATVHLADELLELQELFAYYEKELEACTLENTLLTERVREMGLEISSLKINTRQK